MDKVLLIDEWSNVSINVLEESAGNTRLIAKGRFGLSDTPTANKRVYKRKLMEREVHKKQSAIKENTVYGELDHPGDGKTKLSRSSHRITKLQMKPNGEIYGEALVMDTSKGKELKAIVGSGGKVGVSSRGWGTTRPDGSGNDIVQEDYNLITFDFVADPAAVNSYPDFKEETSSDDNVTGVNEQKHNQTQEGDGDSDMTIEEFRKKYPELYNNIVSMAVKETKEEIEKQSNKTKEELKKEIEDNLKQDFAKKLEDKVGTIKSEAKEEVRGELLSDPGVAGAKVTLEDIAKKLIPYLLPEDVNDLVSQREKEISDLKEQLKKVSSELKEKVEALEKERDDYMNVAKRIGFEHHLTNIVNEIDENLEVVKNNIGDIMRFKSISELEESVRLVINKVKKQSEAERAVTEEVQKLKDDNDKLSQSVTEAHIAARQLALQLYVERKISDHPHKLRVRKIIEGAISNGAANNQQEINDIIDEYDDNNPVSEEYNSITRSLRKGRNDTSIDSDTRAKKLDEGDLFGIGIDTLVDLSGIKKE
jgi:hypothetical protein